MTHAVFLCNKEWIITRTLHTSPELTVPEGSGLFALLLPDSPRPDALKTFSTVTLRLTPEGPELSALVCTFPLGSLVMGFPLNATASIHKLHEFYTECLDWAAQNLQDLYTDDYYQIQQMNNQLINSQRALLKANQKLRQALQDVQEANTAIAALERDALTGLYQATGFFRRVRMARAEEPDQPFDLIVLDVAHFTLLDEVFGPRVSNKLLQDLALFLLGLPHADDGLFARAHGDIFYIYMPSRFGFVELLLKELPRFFETCPLPVRMHEMLGVYSSDSSEISPEQMCDRAQLALNTLLARDDLHVARYDVSMQDDILRQHKLLDSVPDALREHQFLLYLQPKVDMFTDEVVGAEALVRWQHPELGFVPPNDFIPLLEQEDAIYPVDQYVWEAACQFLARRKELGLPSMPVSVNVARRDLYRDDLVEVLTGLVKKYGLEPGLLRLEIIERAYTEDSDRIVFRVLSALRAKGFLIEVDDFGTGASTLSMAADMPIDVLKLDRSFLEKFPESPRHTEIVRFVVELAKTLGFHLVVEGVETAQQADALCKLGCRYAQGYYYSRPRPAEEFLH